MTLPQMLGYLRDVQAIRDREAYGLALAEAMRGLPH